MHSAGDLYPGGNGRERGHDDGFLFDAGSKGGDRGAERNRNGGIRPEHKPGANGFHGGGARARPVRRRRRRSRIRAAANATGLSLAVTAPFSLAQNTCGSSLGAGASCSVQVVFTPTANGTAQGTLTDRASSLNTATAMLSGTGGLAGTVQLQPASLSFSPTGVGTTSGAQTIAVTNASTVVLSDLALTISNGFQLASDTCTTSLAPGASCTVGVVFAPAGAGQQTGNLTVASSMLASNVQAPLSGMGTDFTVSLSGSSSQTVASGQTASYALVLTPMSGSSATFTFQCGSLPANAACVFNPASETVAANSTGSVTVRVATGHSGSSARSSGLAGWGAAPLACGLLLLPFAWAPPAQGPSSGPRWDFW